MVAVNSSVSRLLVLLMLGVMMWAGSATNAAGGTEFASAPDQVEHYRDSIDRILDEVGPYALELSDLHVGLGHAFFEAGEYLKARDAINRGVMVMRVNFGPNSPEQTDYLFLLANIELMLGGLESHGDILDSIYRINLRHYGDDSVELLPVLERLYRWNPAIHPIGSFEADYFDYVGAIKLTHRMTRVSETAFGPVHEQTALSYRRHGEARFRLVRFLRANKTRQKSLHGADKVDTPRTRSITAGIPEGDHYRAGLEAFEKYEECVRLNASTTPAEHARVLADIGDWLLVLEKYERSEDYYRKSCEVLDCNNTISSRESGYFGQPEPTHLATDSLTVSGPSGETANEANEGFTGLKLDVSMTVTRLGDIQKIEILNPPGFLSEKQLQDIEGQVAGNPFRPAMRDGELVTTREFVWQYELAANPAQF